MLQESKSQDDLSENQQQILRSFQEIVQIADEGLCIQILEQNNWVLEQAVSRMVNDQASPNTNSTSNDGTPRIRRNNSSSASTANTRSEPQTPQNVQAVAGPLDFLFLPLRWLFQARPVSMNPSADTSRFIDEFNLKYTGEHQLALQNSSYQVAVATAFQASKFLLVYLHSPIHEDTNRFCRNVLCSQAVTTIANQQLISWAGKVWDPEAYGLSSQLKVTAYPFVALLVCQSNRVVQIADKIEGYVNERTLVTKIEQAVATFTNVIVRNRQETNRREESTRLREQQDREYREAQEADRLETIRRQEEEAAAAAAEEERKQQEELRQAVELSEKLTREDKFRKLRATVEANPEPENNAEAATVRFQLPKGAKLSRRFHKNSNTQEIFDYLTLYFYDNGDSVNNFSVNMNYPKMELTDMSKTILELGLHPRGMLYVNDLDS